MLLFLHTPVRGFEFSSQGTHGSMHIHEAIAADLIAVNSACCTGKAKDATRLLLSIADRKHCNLDVLQASGRIWRKRCGRARQKAAAASGLSQQQDAQEFLTYLLDQAHEELKRLPDLYPDISAVSEGELAPPGPPFQPAGSQVYVSGWSRKVFLWDRHMPSMASGWMEH